MTDLVKLNIKAAARDVLGELEGAVFSPKATEEQRNDAEKMLRDTKALVQEVFDRATNSIYAQRQKRFTLEYVKRALDEIRACSKADVLAECRSAVVAMGY